MAHELKNHVPLSCTQTVGAQKAASRAGKAVADRGYPNDIHGSIRAENGAEREREGESWNNPRSSQAERWPIKFTACFPERKGELHRRVVFYPQELFLR